MKRVWLLSFCLLFSNQPLLSNSAQEIVAHFFNIVTAGLLMVTAKENREQRVAAATSLVASLSAMTQKILEEPSDESKRNSLQLETINFIEEIHRLLLERIINDKELKTLIEDFILIYELHRQLELQNGHGQID